MNDERADLEFAKASRAVDKTTATIAANINELLNKPYEAVARDWLVQCLLIRLADHHAALVDQMTKPGPDTLKLSNALLDYRDARFEDR